MLFSGRLRAGFLPGWLSLVRPRKGSQSAGLIIWFERSGGRGFDRRPLSRAPPPALCLSGGTLTGLAPAQNVNAAVLSAHVGDVAHLSEETCFDDARNILQFLVDNFW